MSYGDEQQERWRLCRMAAKIWDVLDTNGRVCRNVVNREPCGTVEES